jgi:hypothetical protein
VLPSQGGWGYHTPLWWDLSTESIKLFLMKNKKTKEKYCDVDEV